MQRTNGGLQEGQWGGQRLDALVVMTSESYTTAESLAVRLKLTQHCVLVKRE